MAEQDQGFVIYVRGSTRDNQMIGADIIGHRLLMMLALKELQVHASIVPVDVVNFSNVLASFPYKKLPTLVLGEEDFNDPTEIEDAFEKSFEPSLIVQSNEINMFTTVGPGSTVFQKFNQFIKNHDPNAEDMLKDMLSNSLKKVNSFLLSDKLPKNENGEREFLGGSQPKIPDCYLLPKLHYMYVACTYVKKFPLESLELEGISDYLERGRKHPAFLSTGPTKIHIIDFYANQASLPSRQTNEIIRKLEREEAAKVAEQSAE